MGCWTWRGIYLSVYEVASPVEAISAYYQAPSAECSRVHESIVGSAGC